ncbi:hypothetical protein, partial [uncultured Sutterella sp.]|uniref:hypothetical protein n=1 Tax=uncultured Sutterella sp. TaxID=286133 RepID=UPI00280BAD3A
VQLAELPWKFLKNTLRIRQPISRHSSPPHPGRGLLADFAEGSRRSFDFLVLQDFPRILNRMIVCAYF